MRVVASNPTVRAKTASVALRDALGRPLASLRLSVTDRCNLRCIYCMPEEHYRWLPQDHLLSFEELVKLVDIFTALGVRRIRLTGGEPLLRRDLDRLVSLLAANPLIEDLALTTNGILLAKQAEALHRAGLHRVTVSLDTLRPERFLAITRRDDHARVLNGIAAARHEGFSRTKIDAVIIRGVNDDELSDLIEFGRANDAEVRFIEYMDVPGATQWTMKTIVSRSEMLGRLERCYGRITAVASDGSSPASRFLLPDGTVFGIIASTTAPFCARCDRSRLTADGIWYRCLYAMAGTDLRRILRSAARPDEIAGRIADLVRSVWRGRADRGAEQRKANHARTAFVPLDTLLCDPHFEMHTRGG
jgi:cyclic pyranopterin phosphate synthase